MNNFENLVALYNSIAATERSVTEFSECAIYELDGGISGWIKTKKAVLDNIAKQKQLLKTIRDYGSEITFEQRAVMQNWNLD